MPAAARAAGPGVALYVNSQPPIVLKGSRFAFGDVARRSYTRRRSPSQPGTKVALRGLSVRALLQHNGVDPDRVSFVNIQSGSGGVVTLRRTDLAEPPPFPEGPALITDDGTTTRFFRPVRGPSDANAQDEVFANATTGPLQINVDSGDIKVVASASRNRISAGGSVTFGARVSFRPPGAQLTYEWDFGDGDVKRTTGTTIGHVYDTPGSYQVRVSVRGTGGADQRCATYCGGTDAVNVTVGDPPRQPTTTTPSPGSGTGDPNAAGSATGTGGGGQGGSGGSASGTGSDRSGASEPSAAAKPKPKPKRPFGVPISGVLIDDTGASVRKLPGGQRAGARKGARQTAGGDSASGIEIPLTGLLALTFVSLGALRERRGVKLPDA